VPFPLRQRLSRNVLLGPAFVCRAAARAARTPEEAWLLRQPRRVRESFVREVLDRGEDPVVQERWMLQQADPVRKSYVREVLEAR
jgi:hypothetical protein